jgi:ketosteroid isomerase-like protein
MSQQNLEVARQGFAAFSSGAVDAMLAHCSPDLVVYPFPEWMEAREYRGHDGFLELIAGWTEGFEDFAPEIHELREFGDSVVVWLGWNTGRIKATNIPIRQPVGGIYSFEEGLVTEIRYFLTWEEALEAAALLGSA